MIPADIALQQSPRINSGIPFLNEVVSNSLPVAIPYYSANTLQIWIGIGIFIWLLGFTVMVIYGVASFILLKRKMRGSVQLNSNIYEAKNIKSPFVLGIFRPRIYLPAGLSEHERGYILLHEQTHIRRYDHVVKLAAYFILCLHWFNPFVWLAFLLMSADMEMSCDERVLKELGDDMLDDYSMSLIQIASGRRPRGGSPLAFGEGGTKERVKRILNFRKPSRVIIVFATTLVVVLSVGFAVNRIPVISLEKNDLIEMKIIYEDNPAYFFQDMKLIWGDKVYYAIPVSNDRQGRQIGFADDEFSRWSIFEIRGVSHDYLLAVESEDVWRVMSIHPPQEPLQRYILENATDEDRLLRTLSVSLYADGRAGIAESPLSSYGFFEQLYFTVDDGDLLIHNSDKSIMIIFHVDPDGVLVFQSSTVPLRAEVGARYVAK